MSNILSFIIPGPPVGKQRARTFRHKQSGRIISMTPAKTVNYEALVKQTFDHLFPGAVPIEGPVSISLCIALEPSKALAAKIEKSGTLKIQRPTKRPDCSNVLKAIEDALNGMAYRDDAQIAEVHIEKVYALKPCVRVTIGEMFSRGEAA
jgi:Holliday junction resolvase RusA-like endonuclease